MKFSNPISQQIWKDRYCKNNETLEDNLHRVAKFCSKNEIEENLFFDMMDKGYAFPAGRTMSNAGIGKNLTLNNCFVAPQIKDSLDDIFDKVKLGAITHQKGGGIGYDFSQLRPKGTPTSNDAIASGAVSFMDCFNAQTATILQGNRRGANMGMMNIYSIDIESFINSKSEDVNKLNHFNISVVIDDNFMRAKNKNEDIWLHFPVYDENGFVLNDETKWQYKKKINAKYLWDLIIQKAYDTGEPGIYFYDNANEDNPLYYIESIVCSNPCFEYLAGTIYGLNPLTGEKLNSSEYGGACNLGSLILHNFVLNPFAKDARIDFESLRTAISKMVRLLDNIIDINKFPNEIYENYQKAFRTIGLGVTSVADTLTMLNLKYNSSEALKFIDNLMNFISYNAYKSSVGLAIEKGCFPFLDRDKYVKNGYLVKHAEKYPEWEELLEDIKKHGIRNAKILALAPTGTQSLTYGNNCSSGVEPIFQLSQKRKVKIGGQAESNIEILDLEDYSYKLWKETKENNIVKKDVFVSTLDISVEDHINMLKTIAWHVDMSVSKTINVPTSYSIEQTNNIYDMCWEGKIKGCTIFRPNNIRQGILIEDKMKSKTKETNLAWGTTIESSDDLIGKKKKIMTGCGTLHIQGWFDPYSGKLTEIYLSKGSTGGCNSWMISNSRTMSAALRTGVSFEYLVDQLKSASACPSFVTRTATKKDTSRGSSCPSAVANALIEMQKEVFYELGIEEEIDEIKSVTEVRENKKPQKNECPECGESLIFEGGCISCKSCGYSKCE